VVPTVQAGGVVNSTIGTPFSFLIVANNNPALYDAVGLPAGLTVNPTSGAITGTPSAFGSFTVTLVAANGGGVGTNSLQINVPSNLPAAPVINSALAVTGQVNATFNYQITALNSPSTYGASGLLAGLALNPATGLISGTPQVAGAFTIALAAQNSGGTGTNTLALLIKPTAPVISSAAAASGVTGNFFGYLITAAPQPDI
jgi:hypothetical protein